MIFGTVTQIYYAIPKEIETACQQSNMTESRRLQS